jgi:peptidoglycan/xylan/chitin deacetylase (PgdA/CDA1 family)
MNDNTQKLLSTMALPMKLDRLIKWTGQTGIFPFYHAVSPEPLPHISHLYRIFSPDEFEQDLDELLQYFKPLSLAEYLAGGTTKAYRPFMVLSFDDGLKGCHEYIAPLLKKKGIPAVFFLNNRFIDNRGLFYRYKASLLIHRSIRDCRAQEQLAEFLKVSKEQVETSIRMISWDQRALLDVMATETELDFSGYLRAKPVYMTKKEVRQLLRWGFEVGAHSSEHIDFMGMDPEQMIEQVSSSVKDLQKRFEIKTAYFSFPFSSDGVPQKVIDTLLKDGHATALLGTAGLKLTGRRNYIQRVPMDRYESTALESLKGEYLYYMLKKALGKNRLRY